MKSTLVVLMLLIACRVAVAEDPTITLGVKDMPLQAVARVIAKQAGWTVVVSPVCAEKKITLDLKDAPPANALKMIAVFAGVKLESLGEDAYWIGPPLEAWEKKTHEALIATRLNVNFEATSIQDALGFVSQMTGVSMVLDPEVVKTRKPDELELGAHIEGIRGRDLLSVMAESLDLAWDVRWGGVFVSTKKRLASLPRYGMDPPRVGRMSRAESTLRKRLATERLAFDFAETPLNHVIDFIRNVRNLDIIVDESVRPAVMDAIVTLKMMDATVQHALDASLIPRGFRFELTAKGETFQVTVMKAR